MFDPEKYLSVIWQKGGRAFPFLDCYGVTREVRQDLGLPVWPVFEGVCERGQQASETADGFHEHVEKCLPEHGAVAECYTAGLVTHLGIVISMSGALLVLECNPRRNVTILPLGRFIRQYSRVEFYK